MVIGAAVVAGAAGSLVTYQLSSGEKTGEGYATATLLGGAFGLAGGVVGGAVSSIVASRASSAAASAASAAATRVAELQAALPAGSSGRVTMAAGVGRDALGGTKTVIGISEKGGYIRKPLTSLGAEDRATGIGHAETSVLDYMSQNGITPLSVGAGCPICPACAVAIEDAGASPATVLRTPQ